MFKPLGRLTELTSGQSRRYDIGDFDVVVYNISGEFYAIENRCSHDDGELFGGELDDSDPQEHVVICPRHGARFCLKTGAALSPPAYEPVTVVPIVVEGEWFGLKETIDA